jgi:hypothetical protein
VAKNDHRSPCFYRKFSSGDKAFEITDIQEHEIEASLAS